MPFSRICSLTLPGQKLIKFSAQIPSGWDTSNSEFELRHSRNMYLQSLSYFLLFFAHFRNRYNSCDLMDFLEIWNPIRTYQSVSMIQCLQQQDRVKLSYIDFKFSRCDLLSHLQVNRQLEQAENRLATSNSQYLWLSGSVFV